MLYYVKSGAVSTHPMDLFNKRNRKVVNAIWIFLGIVVIISMIALYVPALYS